MGPFRAFVIDSHVSRGGRLWSADRPRAQLGLARAYAAEGDGENGRKAYEDFFTTGKDADPDIPILRRAKAEYKKLAATASAVASASGKNNSPVSLKVPIRDARGLKCDFVRAEEVWRSPVLVHLPGRSRDEFKLAAFCSCGETFRQPPASLR